LYYFTPPHMTRELEMYYSMHTLLYAARQKQTAVSFGVL